VAESLRLAGGAGPLFGALVRAVPATFADRLYDAVARARRRLFGAPSDVCPRVPASARARLLP
jgi:predicted DCC family thiol-disulfide oxidoreductase YuxK